MNVRKIAIISVCLNLLLLGVVAILSRRPPPPMVIVLETNAPLKVVERRVDVPVRVPEPFDWTKVESEDYREYIANLRTVGCPEQTVRDIIIADVNALFEARRRGLIQPHEEFKFWQADVPPIFSSPPAQRIREQFEQLRLLAEEKRAVLRELLGIDVPQRVEAAFAPLNPREQLMTFLPEEKRLRLEEIEQRFSALLMQRRPDASGNEQLSNYKMLQSEKIAEIAAVLTPSELEEYRMRFSPTAVGLRSQLGSLNPTEHEFREMVRIRSKYDEEFGGIPGADRDDPAVLERRAAARREVDEQMRRVLGAERYAEYQRERDWGYQGAVAVAEQEGLPRGLGVAIFEMKGIAEAEARRIHADRSLSEAERQLTLDEVRLAVEDAVRTLLGPDGFRGYEKQPGAHWLRDLNRSSGIAQAAQ